MAEFSLAGKRIFVAGHRGMVGSACVRRLEQENCEIITATRDAVDLVNQEAVNRYVQEARPDIVLIAAAKVGGIVANDTYPAEFLYENLMIEANLINASYHAGVGRLLFLGSSCIYPKEAPQPIREDALLTGKLEASNEWYAIAKIAGIKLCQAYRKQYGAEYISAMPSNLYGPNDYFHPKNSHVIPGMLRRFHEAKLAGDKEVTCWGSGRPRREFLHVDDLADACVFLLKHYSGDEHVNVGTGSDISIKDLAETIARVVGFNGSILWDSTKPDGTMLKRMDISKIEQMGWQPHIAFDDGLAQTYQWFVQQEHLRS
ncbi:MAG: GDP-L-fucose synthase [Rhizobiaceae bacterium]|nr:GDP-L-fucose synthase [Rhizobiaceae bacterium]